VIVRYIKLFLASYINNYFHIWVNCERQFKQQDQLEVDSIIIGSKPGLDISGIELVQFSIMRRA